jgi:hypothetical protein
MRVDNPFKLGIYQAYRWFPFLFPHLVEDVEQTVRLVCLTYDPNVDIRQFNNALNRSLYRLSRDYGYRKPHKNENRPRKWYQASNVPLPVTDKGLYALKGKI